MTNSRWIIVTTINPPTPAIEALAQLAPAWKLLVVADKKTPSSWSYPGATFLSLDDQASLGFQLSAHAPFNHYARKNIGYLFALRAGAEVILETDDDNLPYDTYPGVISQSVEGRLVQKKNWENVYTHFSPSRIWPRGFPLEFINDSLRQKSHLSPKSTHECDIQQYLADDNPDVDAVFRLTNEGAEFFSGEDVVLGPGSWCPFNSQNTLWWPRAYPFLYLPFTASFRMTDIWRSFVALACVYARNGNIAFRGPTMFQKRNEHSLIRDFADEVSGYLNNHAIMAMLAQLPLRQSPVENLRKCYSAMIERGYLESSEAGYLESWLHDLTRCASFAPVPDV